jgi:hypothetical protein
MSGPTDDAPNFSVEDVLEHIETYGVDLFPPIDLSMETVRAQALFGELRDRWPHLYESMTLGTGEFVITAPFRFSGGREVRFPTFSINARGPVFTFPRRLSVVREDVNLHGVEPADVFGEAFGLFLRTFAPRQALKLGLIRQLLLGTGQTDCTPWLGSRVLQFDSGRLAGAQCILVYHDEVYNYRIQMEAARLMAATPVPATGQVVSEPDQFALSVSLDVNNRNAHPLTPEDRQGVIARASELWPNGLLEFLNHRRLP